MEEIHLETELREEIGKGKVKKIRDAGLIPAVLYGEGKKSKALKISRSQFIKLSHQYHLENMVMTLDIKGDAKSKGHSCLIKEIQYDPVKGEIRHIDFNEISLTKAIKVKVPIVAKGEPVGVKMEGGSLEHILWEVEIECLPTEIPKEIEVDVSQLKMGESIHLKDIKIPANIKVLTDVETLVFSVVEPMKEQVAPAEAVEGEVSQEPEVIKEKKVTAEEAASAEKEKEKEKEKK